MIIGIAGRKQVGKNTVAKMWQYLSSYDVPEYIDDTVIQDFLLYCLENPPSTWKLKSYAHKIKQIVCIMTGCKLTDLEEEDFKASRIPGSETTYRELLQIIGTDIGRNRVRQDIWVNNLLEDYKKGIKLVQPGDVYEYFLGSDGKVAYAPKWLITDVRFPNEIQAIRKEQGIIIKVLRDIDSDDHESEEALNNYHDYDYVIRNFGCLKELMVSVSNILNREKILRNKYQIA